MHVIISAPHLLIAADIKCQTLFVFSRIKRQISFLWMREVATLSALSLLFDIQFSSHISPVKAQWQNYRKCVSSKKKNLARTDKIKVQCIEIKTVEALHSFLSWDFEDLMSRVRRTAVSAGKPRHFSSPPTSICSSGKNTEVLPEERCNLTRLSWVWPIISSLMDMLPRRLDARTPLRGHSRNGSIPSSRLSSQDQHSPLIFTIFLL